MSRSPQGRWRRMARLRVQYHAHKHGWDGATFRDRPSTRANAVLLIQRDVRLPPYLPADDADAILVDQAYAHVGRLMDAARGGEDT